MGFAAGKEAEKLGVHGNEVTQPRVFLILSHFSLLHAFHSVNASKTN